MGRHKFEYLEQAFLARELEIQRTLGRSLWGGRSPTQFEVSLALESVRMATGRVRFGWSAWAPKTETRPELQFGLKFTPKTETHGYPKPDR